MLFLYIYIICIYCLVVTCIMTPVDLRTNLITKRRSVLLRDDILQGLGAHATASGQPSHSFTNSAMGSRSVVYQPGQLHGSYPDLMSRTEQNTPTLPEKNKSVEDKAKRSKRKKEPNPENGERRREKLSDAVLGRRSAAALVKTPSSVVERATDSEDGEWHQRGEGGAVAASVSMYEQRKPERRSLHFFSDFNPKISSGGSFFDRQMERLGELRHIDSSLGLSALQQHSDMPTPPQAQAVSSSTPPAHPVMSPDEVNEMMMVAVDSICDQVWEQQKRMQRELLQQLDERLVNNPSLEQIISRLHNIEKRIDSTLDTAQVSQMSQFNLRIWEGFTQSLEFIVSVLLYLTMTARIVWLNLYTLFTFIRAAPDRAYHLLSRCCSRGNGEYNLFPAIGENNMRVRDTSLNHLGTLRASIAKLSLHTGMTGGFAKTLKESVSHRLLSATRLTSESTYFIPKAIRYKVLDTHMQTHGSHSSDAFHDVLGDTEPWG
eukprot:GHVR01162756.1.p1 GENE.GHVR01162756.1~~GHVR01162756.1.p1  ORF type:complete len:489 (-),score=76.78 GHVR01162756.1:283-1749(-)